MAPSALCDPRLMVGALAMALATSVTSDRLVLTDCPQTRIGDNSMRLAHETDCTKYYGCRGTVKFEMQCPTMDRDGNRFRFNSITRVCDSPENVVCKPPRPIAAIPSRVPVPTACPPYNSLNYTVHLAHEKDCTKFYKCDWGRKIAFDCPFCNKKGDRLHFNPVLQVCDWPWNAGCGDFSANRRSPCFGYTGGAVTVSSDGCIGTCPTDDTGYFNLLLANVDPKKFCICSDGVPYVHDCPKDRPYWNDTDKKCAKF